MAEGEDVIVDVARHATNYAQALWRRHVPRARNAPLSLAELAPRLALLIRAASGLAPPLRAAQAPAPPTLLSKLFRRSTGPLASSALPATDGNSIWLPASLSELNGGAGLARYRVMALQQAFRVLRGSAELLPTRADPLLSDLYLLFEAAAADADLVAALPGIVAPLRELRAAARAGRPPVHRLSPARRAVEAVFLEECSDAIGSEGGRDRPPPTVPSDSLRRAVQLAGQLHRDFPQSSFGSQPIYRDHWLGELMMPATKPIDADAPIEAERAGSVPAKTARLARRPRVRQAQENEDDVKPGAWMVQTSQPQEKAEEPFGLERPTDRDLETAAEELADGLSELSEARLVSSATPAREFLLSEDPPEASAKRGRPVTDRSSELVYPEWDYRLRAYHAEAATVRVTPCEDGPQPWVEQTLDRQRSMLERIRRQFELLRARRSRLRKQMDGDELDLEAYLESQTDFRAGLPLAQRLYQTERRVHREIALVLLVDVSGSTESWVAGNRRIIDVEREALLLVCVALEDLRQPYAVQTFSSNGPGCVTIRNVKTFEESFSNAVGLRISGLEPEQYTRVGAAIRHATATLMRQQAQHRLLLLLSDGKPNDVDEYSGRYGVEDFRQAIAEAKLQGVSPFCLTVDRHAAAYLPFVFGAGHYALLTRPELLPVVLLDWLRRLITT